MCHSLRAALSCDIDGLLDGLGEDDFNLDCELCDSCGELTSADPPVPSSQPHPPSDNDPFDEFLSPTPVPAVIPATVSFGTAGGKRLKGPSAAALQRAQKLMREAEREVEEQEAKRRKTEEERDQKAADVLREFPPPAPDVSSPDARDEQVARSSPSRPPLSAEAVSSPSSGFALGTGGSAPRPSAERLAAARALLDQPTAPSPPRTDSSPSRGPTPQPSGFSLGTGRSAPAPSAASLAAATALLDEPTPGSPKPPPTAGFLLGTGRSAPQPSPANLARARALLDDEPLSSPVRHSTPSRAPLRSTTNTFDSPIATPIKAKLGSLGSPATPRRIGLGSPARGRRKPFSSPFKAPGAARPLPGSGLRAPALVPPKVEKIWKPVFDLAPPPERQSMRAAGLEPGRYSVSNLKEQGM